MMKKNINIYNSQDEYLAQMKSGALLNPGNAFWIMLKK